MSADSSVETLKKVHSARSELYAFLSRVFSNVPDNEMYQILADISPKLKMLSEDTDDEDIKTGAEGVADFLEKRNSLADQELFDFDLERSRHYTTLFCLPKASIPSDESNYTAFNHESRDKSYNQMLELFGKYKMTKANIPENEDFIGYELLFMSKLAYDCVEFIERSEMDNYHDRLRTQYHFHVEHLDKWAYDFFGRVINFGLEDEILYKFFACFAAQFLKEDKIVLEELLAE